MAFGAPELGPICRLALMVICNAIACSEGRTALMDILDDTGSGGSTADLEEWCVSAMYAMSRGSLRYVCAGA